MRPRWSLTARPSMVPLRRSFGFGTTMSFKRFRSILTKNFPPNAAEASNVRGPPAQPSILTNFSIAERSLNDARRRPFRRLSLGWRFRSSSAPVPLSPEKENCLFYYRRGGFARLIDGLTPCLTNRGSTPTTRCRPLINAKAALPGGIAATFLRDGRRRWAQAFERNSNCPHPPTA